MIIRKKGGEESERREIGLFLFLLVVPISRLLDTGPRL